MKSIKSKWMDYVFASKEYKSISMWNSFVVFDCSDIDYKWTVVIRFDNWKILKTEIFTPELNNRDIKKIVW